VDLGLKNKEMRRKEKGEKGLKGRSVKGEGKTLGTGEIVRRGEGRKGKGKRKSGERSEENREECEENGEEYGKRKR